MIKPLTPAKKALAIILPAVLFYAITLVFSCKTITVRTYNAETSLFAEGGSVKLVLVSDLHSTVYGKDQEPLIQMITEQEPDLILLTGDIFDSGAPMTGAELFLSKVIDIAPVYFVSGNHEFGTKKIREIRNMLDSVGVRILYDEYVNIEIDGNEIILAGIEDPVKQIFEIKSYNQNASMEANFRELDNIEKYKILLSHKPERIEYFKNFSFDMVLSGHTHGGQVRIPYLVNGFYAPGQGLFPKYGGGMYEHENLVHIISRGLSLRPVMFPRIFNPPELVVIIIKSNRSA